MKQNILISVESRKGGVGKTTAALCVSKCLLEKDYAVLLIDTDITGTNIIDCVGSPFWNNYINILTVTENNNTPTNLLSLFDNNFMNGNKIPSFQANEFNTDLKKINIIGSQIYSHDGKTTTICEPAILFDQLHGYWFVDFLKELVEDFAETTKGKPVAVILDNSPGYVGIAPAIQAWLTDLGPETSKFLMVTSLDSQDLRSCEQAISILHEQYKEKWNTSRMFLKAKNGNGNDLDYSLMKGDFFIKLTEHEELVGNRKPKFPASFTFYNKPEGNDYSMHPEKYLGVVVNRVPKTIFRHRRTYQPNLHNSLFLDLLGGHYSREWSMHMVEYDSYIEYQFLLSGMSKRRYKGKWNRNLDRLLKKESALFHDKNPLHITDMVSPESFSHINNYVSRFQNIIDTAIDAMRTNNLDYLADLIDEDWQPKGIVKNLRTAFYNFMTNADHPLFKEMYWEEFEDEEILEEKGLYRLKKILNNLDIPLNNEIEYQEIRNAIFYLIASLPLPFSRKMPLEEEIIDFLHTIIKLEIKLIKEANNKYLDLPRILSTEIKNKEKLKDLWHDFKFSKWFMRHEENEFFDFFDAFTSAQARLMRLPEDSYFLIWLIQMMVKFENEKPNTLPYVKNIAEDVILHKTLSYDAVREKSSSALSEAQYFMDFDRVIKSIIDCWGIA